jgi:hypothetical protein
MILGGSEMQLEGFNILNESTVLGLGVPYIISVAELAAHAWPFFLMRPKSRTALELSRITYTEFQRALLLQVSRDRTSSRMAFDMLYVILYINLTVWQQ